MTIRFPAAKRGSTYSHTLDFSVSSGSIADCVLRMMIKRYASDADSEALVSIDSDALGGIEIITPTSPCRIRITIADDAMATLPAPKNLVAGIQVELPDGTTEEITNLDQTFPVRADVVRATASP